MNGCEQILLHQPAVTDGDQTLPKAMARGPNFIYGREYMLTAYGENFWDTLLSQLPDEARQVWNQNLLTVGQYPLIALKQMVYAAAKKTGKEKYRIISEMYETISDRSLNNLYKVFFSLTNPSFVISNYPNIWQRFFSMQSMDVSVSEKEHAVIHFQLTDIYLDWLPAACYGFSKKAIQLAGGYAFEMELLDKKRLSDEQWHISYTLRWREKYQSFRLSKH